MERSERRKNEDYRLTRSRQWRRNSAACASLTLGEGAKIAVIGAGPAGTFFADFAAQLAKKSGMHVSIVLFDGKDFTQKGPRGCNLCAGVISETLVKKLEERGIFLPEERVQRKIEGYHLRGRSGNLLLKHRRNERRITTVFRGNGPRLSSPDGNISFDDFLLEWVKLRGSAVVQRPVKRIELQNDPRDPVKVVYGAGKDEEVFYADLVVGAFGLSESTMRKVEELGFGYRAPRTVKALNVEIRLKEEFIREQFDDHIFAYNLSTVKGTCVASIIPKKDFVTVNMVGIRDVEQDEFRRFLELLVSEGKLPGSWDWSRRSCSCAPRIPVTAARNPYTDRLVIIGDASCSRYYKNGIESAFITARTAAQAAFGLGISAGAFRKGYYRKIKKMIIRDNIYGSALFSINNLVSGSSFLSEVIFAVAEGEEGRKVAPMRDVLWNMYTGNIPYRTIFLKFFNPLLQAKLMIYSVRLLFRRLFLGRSVPAGKHGEPR